MSGTSSNPGEIFDIRKIRRLVELMKEYELGEIDLRQGEMRVRLIRGQAGGPPTVITSPVPQPAAAAVQAAAPAEAAPAAKPAEDLAEIKSPMVGTFYTASSPDAPAFVKVGDRVSADSTICIIEAMKVFNEIQAEISGTIAEVCVDNGDPVEFGQVLFRVKKS